MPIMIPTLVAEVQGVYFGMVKFGKGPHAEPWEMHQNHVSGIPITVDLLVSIGFTAEVDLDSEPYFAMKRFEVSKYDFLHQDSEWFITGMNGFQSEVKIEFLHQLQNLFFAVTGEEIEIPEKEAGVICRI